MGHVHRVVISGQPRGPMSQLLEPPLNQQLDKLVPSNVQCTHTHNIGLLHYQLHLQCECRTVDLPVPYP